MTDESKTNKSGTGVAKGESAEVLHPDRMLLDHAVAAAPFTVRLTLPEGAAVGSGDVIPLADFLARGKPAGVGVLLRGSDDPALIRDVLSTVPVVALHFPIFSDGRGYSHAWRLRKAWRYGGVILACGDVLRDQLLYMSRVGINAFYMRADQKLEESLAAFSLYSAFYQYHDVAR